MACHLGDFTEYVQLSRQIAELEKKASKSNERHARAQAHHSIQQLLPGDIIYIPHGRSRGYAVVITRSDSHADPRIGIVTEDAHQRTASTRDFEGAIEPVSRIKIPKRLSLKTPKERRDTASRMRQALYDGRAPARSHSRTSRHAKTASTRSWRLCKLSYVTTVPRLLGPREPHALGRALAEAQL